MSAGGIRRLGRNRRGATAVEYALLASLLSTGILGAFMALGGGVTDVFGGVGQQISRAAGEP